MNNGELLRLIDAIHRDKDINREDIFQAIESALTTAAKKRLASEQAVVVEIDRDTGSITAHTEQGDLDPGFFGRIAAQTAKQVILQKIREAERDVIYTDFEGKKHDVVAGSVLRYDGPNVIVGLGKSEGILPKREQVPDEVYNIGDRIRTYVLDVRKVGQRVRIILSRAHPDFIRRLFELEVPELAERIIEIKGLVREAGYRTKIAVVSVDQRVDCVGACVGVRGSRIRTIIEELGGEKIDIIRWSDSPEVLLMHALKPAAINQIQLDQIVGKARVIVEEDQLSLAIGRRGQNVRLASRLSGWEIDILSPDEYVERQKLALRNFEQTLAFSPTDAEKILKSGYLSLTEMLDAGVEQLEGIEGFAGERAAEIMRVLETADLMAEADAIKAIGRGRAERAAATAAGPAGTANGAAAAPGAPADGAIPAEVPATVPAAPAPTSAEAAAAEQPRAEDQPAA